MELRITRVEADPKNARSGTTRIDPERLERRGSRGTEAKGAFGRWNRYRE